MRRRWGMSPATSTRERVETFDESRTLPPWSVVLHNSWHPMSYVVWVLIKMLPGVRVRQATRLMLKAHREGRATVKSCHRELAEHYSERIAARGLRATAEPAE